MAESKITRKFNISEMGITVTSIILMLLYSVRAFSTDYYVDSEIINTKEYLYNWDSIGRFGLIWIKKLTGLDWINPYMEAALFLIALSLVACLAMSLIKYLESDIKDVFLVVFALLALVYPTYADQFLFRFQSFEVTLAMLFVVLASYLLVLFLDKKYIWMYVTSITLLVLSFAVYQSMANLMLLFYGALLMFLCRKRDAQYVKKGFLFSMIQFVSSFGVYFLIDKIFYNDGTYIAGKIGWKTDSVSVCVQNIKDYVKDIVFANNPFYTRVFSITVILFVTAVIFSLSKVTKKEEYKIISTLIGALVTVSSPFYLTVIQGRKADYRAQIMLPWCIAFMWIYAVTVFASYGKKTMERIAPLLLLVGIVSIFVNASETERFFYTESVIAKNDKILATGLINDIEKCDTDKKVVFIGKREEGANASCYTTKDVLTYQTISVYRLDCDANPMYYHSTKRILGYFETMGFKYNRPDETDMNEAYEISKEMPVYPTEGSIKETENLIVVKIGEE